MRQDGIAAGLFSRRVSILLRTVSHPLNVRLSAVARIRYNVAYFTENHGGTPPASAIYLATNLHLKYGTVTVRKVPDDTRGRTWNVLRPYKQLDGATEICDCKGSLLQEKHILRKIGARTKNALIEAMGRALAAVDIQDAWGYFAHCGYRTPMHQL